MTYYKVSKNDMDILVPNVKESIEKGLEFLLLDQMNLRCKSYLPNMKIYNYTMDSYNNMKKCMSEPIARENGLLNGLEYIMEQYLNSPNVKNILDKSDLGDKYKGDE